MMAEFHFLRPEWFLALIPMVALLWIMRQRQARGSSWYRTIDPALLDHLIVSPSSKPGGNPLYLIALAWLLAVIALAGPVWQKIPQPVHEKEDALVILLDLSKSMYAEDVAPNRLVRAQRKLLDLLEMRNEGVTGLIVYAGDPHTVSPLTDDAKTMSEMIPAVSPEIMPAPGSQLAPALEQARQLMIDGGVANGRILILTDEIRDLAQAQAKAREFRTTYPISVLSVGTEQGAPIPHEEGGFVKDRNGTIVIPGVDFSKLRDFALLADGRFSRMTLTDEDLDYLLADLPDEDLEADFRQLDRDFDSWVEEGPWLVLLLLPFAALAFRRGWLWCLALLVMAPVDNASASFWDDLWKNNDQQAHEVLRSGDPATAAEMFEDPAWKATAQYRNKDYSGAAASYSGIEGSDSTYNLGNALAYQGDYEGAISAYNKALMLNPDNEDAAFNKELVEKLLEAQQQDQQEEGESSEEDQENEDNQQNQDQQQQDQGSEDEQSQQDQQDESGEEQETDEQQEAEPQEDDQEGQDQQMSEAEGDPLTEEEEQALRQWLKRVPDDPGGLLRRKFKQQYDERTKRGQTSQNDSMDW